MRELIKITLILGFILVQFQVNSQQRHLSQVGTLDSLYSSQLKENRMFWVQLPDYYDENRDYPVVYVLDGGVQLPNLATVYGNYWGHYLPDMILVGISNRTHRTRDLTTSKIRTMGGVPYEQENGEAEHFTSFIEKELIPFVDKKYPTSSYRTLIGHSYGGLFTINTLLNHSDLFTNYIAIDPSLDWDNQDLLKQAKTKLSNQNFKGKSLFLSMATEQLHLLKDDITIDNVRSNKDEYTNFARSILEFIDVANANSQNELNFSSKQYPNDLHGTVPLPSMHDGLLFLFDWYKLALPGKYNNSETPKNELIKLLEERRVLLSEKFGYPTAPMDEMQLIMLGQMAMQFGQDDKALEILKINMSYYPKSANAVGALADYYESKKDKENALKYLSKAFELSNDQRFKERMDSLKD